MPLFISFFSFSTILCLLSLDKGFDAQDKQLKRISHAGNFLTPDMTLCLWFTGTCLHFLAFLRFLSEFKETKRPVSQKS